jgi:hypothetical protein
MSSKGPSSDGSANVFVASGNGPFGCNTGATDCSDTHGCTSLSGVKYWGSSAIKFPAATTGTPPVMGNPSDFYAPYVETYTTNMPSGDLNAACYQTEELSRLDLDFGVCGVVLIPEVNVFAMTCDKSGYLYVMPAPGSLGLFQYGDVGLTGSTYTTQQPFQITRFPTILNQTCETVNSDGTVITGACDEPHELAFNNDMLFAWPQGEAVLSYTGQLSNSNQTYKFPGPRITPCMPGSSDPCSCTGTNCTPKIPQPTKNSSGGGFALAANNHTPAAATLWAVLPQSNFSTMHSSTNWGQLFAYTVNSDASVSWIWDTVHGDGTGSGSGHGFCASPPAKGWYLPSFTEPTLAEWGTPGSTAYAAYVPTNCVITDSNSYASCQAAFNAGDTGLVSGVLVFTTCP